MLKLTIPQLTEETRETKDLIFTILTKESNLTYMQIYNRIKKSYNISITYQAVRKAVDSLNKEDLLKKQDRKYSISKDWLINLKLFIDKTLTKYETGKEIHEFTEELAKEDYAVYTFNNLLDLDNFWGDIMIYWADHEKENKEFLGYGHYGWWFLINLGRETKIFEYYKKIGIKSSYLFFKNLPLNRWGANLYKEIGVKVKTIDKNDDENIGINILGDTVIQVKYPEKIIKNVRTFFKKYKSIQEMSPKEITSIAHEECEIKFIMFKNKEIAKSLMEKYKYFVR